MSQTDRSDIVEIRQLVDALAQLTVSENHLQRDIHLTRSTLQTEFHRRLTAASEQLYSRMNQRLDQLERSQRDRVEVVRSAFRTQLCDALSQMSALYEERLRKKMAMTQTFIVRLWRVEGGR